MNVCESDQDRLPMQNAGSPLRSASQLYGDFMPVANRFL
jgi:hypothetical protein